MVGRAGRLAVDDGLEHGLDLAVGIDADEIGAELFADPVLAADRLDRFRIEIGAGQVALLGALMDDAERHFLVGVVQEGGRQALDRAGVEIGLELMEEQHRIRRVHLGAEAVVGQHKELAIAERADAGETLHGLAGEGGGEPGRAPARGSHHRADLLDAFAGRNELAGDLEIGRRIGRSRDDRVGRQQGMADQLGREFFRRSLRRILRAGEHGGRQKQSGGEAQTHGTLRLGRAGRPPLRVRSLQVRDNAVTLA